MSCSACARRRAKLKRVAIASCVAMSRLFNTLCNGWLDETFATRSARSKNWYYRLFPKHCDLMVARDEGMRNAVHPSKRIPL